MHLSSCAIVLVVLLLVVFLPSQEIEAKSLNNQPDQQDLISIISGLTEQAIQQHSSHTNNVDSLSSSAASSYDDSNPTDLVNKDDSLSDNNGIEEQNLNLMTKEYLLKRIMEDLKANLARAKAQRLFRDGNLKQNHLKRAACGNLNGNPMYKWICW